MQRLMGAVMGKYCVESTLTENLDNKMYVNLIRTVAKRIAKANGQEDRQNHYDRIVEEFEMGPGANDRRRVEYFAEQVHKNSGWETLLDVVFGDNPYTQNDGRLGLQEWVVDSHSEFINRQSEHGHHRETLFRNSLSGEPEWLKQMVAESEYCYWDGTDPEFWSEEEKAYVNYLENIIEE